MLLTPHMPRQGPLHSLAARWQPEQELASPRAVVGINQRCLHSCWPTADVKIDQQFSTVVKYETAYSGSYKPWSWLACTGTGLALPEDWPVWDPACFPEQPSVYCLLTHLL